jgi:predicted phosphodiesterase
MKILLLSDEECSRFWDYYKPGMFREYELILAAGDLKADYLSFIVTMANKPLLYVHGNLDGRYAQRPPEGCQCIDGQLVKVKGLRILGLGGSMLYSGGPHQYSEKQMRRRINRLRFRLW